MATVERVRSILRREREEVAERRVRVVRERNSTKDKGERGRLIPLLDKYDAHLEVIDYVLNLLDQEEDTKCQD